jgi:hypothetical protein
VVVMDWRQRPEEGCAGSNLTAKWLGGGIHQAARHFTVPASPGAGFREKENLKRVPLMSESRATPRYSLVLSAEMSVENAGPTASARISDISMGGCYIDSANTFPAGTIMHLRLSQQGETFESKARVVCEYPRMGMGMAFLETQPAQLAILERWLAAVAHA